MAKTQNQLTIVANYLHSKVARIGELLPANSGVTAPKLVRVVLLAINDNPALLSCTPESVYAAVLESARLGLEIGGPMAQAYLVPYGRKATFQLGYRGLIDLVIRAGSATDVNVEYVYEGDTFRRELGINGKWVHIASSDQERESKPITHVYAEFLLPDGRVKRHTMTASEINEHARQFSPSFAKKDSAWQTCWKAMAAKTVIRQPILRGLLPVRLPEEAQKHVMWDENPAASIHDFAQTFGQEPPQPKRIEAETVANQDAEPELTEQEKADILAREKLQADAEALLNR